MGKKAPKPADIVRLTDLEAARDQMNAVAYANFRGLPQELVQDEGAHEVALATAEEHLAARLDEHNAAMDKASTPQ
ncbi:hypothetical protein ACT009_09960 [Sphingomonas sp. Tas61C01]|uniref:hypothetical protein n=1 Tax=Sphingomonas sp. Tas61C01 TaxID=3458297 RepID=UPI00403EBCE1